LDKDEVPGRDTSKFENNSNLSISSLHPIEKKLLTVMRLVEAGWVTESELVRRSELTSDQVRRGVEWLRYKDLVQVTEDTDFKTVLHPDRFAMEHLVPPERNLSNMESRGIKKL